MKMNRASLAHKADWAEAQVDLPLYNVEQTIALTRQAPTWLHFGAGNIFRGFIAALQQQLLNQGLAQKGIIAVDTFDPEIIGEIFDPFDNLTMNVILRADATTRCEIIAAVTEALFVGDGNGQMGRLREIFAEPSLQMISFTITEKGYSLRRPDGSLMTQAEEDMNNGPEAPGHVISIVASALHHRYLAGGWPVAVVSMDNCSHNGEILQNAVAEVAGAWLQRGVVEQGFVEYIADSGRVSFPWSMIDKITPSPAPVVREMLRGRGIEGMEPIVTQKQTFIAPFVNAELPQYLVIEDSFPNGRPPLEKTGVYFTDRETVNCVERMKVTTCLNPLHTSMSAYGCLLGYSLISEEMKDPDIVALIKRLGYSEGLPVVTDPGILSPVEFLDEVVEQRLPNPFLPDTPQRIIVDTSQKVGIRFGETIKGYIQQGRDLDTLVAIPLSIAGWLRYLVGVDDVGNAMEIVADPLLEELQQLLGGILWNDRGSYSGQLRGILSNSIIFGSDLTQTTLADTIEAMFTEQLSGAGAVRATLQKHLKGFTYGD